MLSHIQLSESSRIPLRESDGCLLEVQDTGYEKLSFVRWLMRQKTGGRLLSLTTLPTADSEVRQSDGGRWKVSRLLLKDVPLERWCHWWKGQAARCSGADGRIRSGSQEETPVWEVLTIQKPRKEESAVETESAHQMAVPATKTFPVPPLSSISLHPGRPSACSKSE